MGNFMNSIDITKINLRNDIIFKYVFATEESHGILIDLLNAIFKDSGQELISEIEYLNPMNLKEYLTDKSTVIDIKAKDEKGRFYNIEMQVQKEQNFIPRMIFYNAKMLAGQLEESFGYEKLNKTISIAFTDFILPVKEKPIHNIYRLMNVKSHRELADIVEYHFIELPKYKDDRTYDDPINKWLCAIIGGESFINNPGRMPEAIKKEKMIMKAIEKMRKAAADPDVRAIIEFREKAVHDEADRLAYATKKAMLIGEKRGIRLGEKRGRENEKMNIALQMLALNISIDNISSVTGLSADTISKLKQ